MTSLVKCFSECMPSKHCTSIYYSFVSCLGIELLLLNGFNALGVRCGCHGLLQGAINHNRIKASSKEII